jgi:hypothetical protein
MTLRFLRAVSAAPLFVFQRIRCRAAPPEPPGLFPMGKSLREDSGEVLHQKL